MQPSSDQVAHSLAALEISDTPGRTRAAVDDGDTGPLVVEPIDTLPAGLLDELERTIDVRPDRLEVARARIAHGGDLTADELADRIVGRLVCDRLR